MSENVGRLAHPVACFNMNEPGRTLNEFFESDQDHEGIVVMNGETPVGIVMRQDFYQKIGKQYGYSIYMNRPVMLLMKEDFMKVDADTDIAEISLKAMSRSSESLYDLIVVESEGKYVGVVSIKHFLIDLAKKREEEIILLRGINDRERSHRIEIEKMNTAIKSLLDNADQGFLSIDRNFVISDQYSRACVKVFGCEIGGKNLMELLDPYMNSEQKEVFHSVIEAILIENGPLADRIYLSLLPGELIIKGKFISLDYKVITDSASRSIMLIMTDVTAKKELERKMLEERENLRIIVKALSNQYDIVFAIENLKEFFNIRAHEIIKNGCDKAAILSEIYRSIHTFKGDMGQLNMMHASRRLHELENELSGMLQRIDGITVSDIQACIAGIDPQSIIEEDMALIEGILGPGYFIESANLTIPLESILKLEELIRNTLPPHEQSELLPHIRKLRFKNIKDIIRNFDETIRAVSYRLEKTVEPLIVAGDDILIDKDRYRDFIRSLSHIFRNAVDHGLETPEERVIQGKPEYGRIVCSIKETDDGHFSISIRDDGRGISIDRIKDKAIETGLLTAQEISTMNDENILKLVFEDGFSTADSITMFSGRGVGLSAVRAEVEKLGGNITVTTEPGTGTEFRINLPLFA